jgi:hypothetical protein
VHEQRLAMLRRTIHAYIAERYRVWTLAKFLYRYSPKLWAMIELYGLGLAYHHPAWLMAMYRRNRRLAMLLDFIYDILKRHRGHLLGRLSVFIAEKYLIRRARKSISTVDALLDFYRTVVGMWAILVSYEWKLLQRRLRAAIFPIGYIEYVPKTRTFVKTYLNLEIFAGFSEQQLERLSRCISELVWGRITVEEAMQRYPEFRAWLEHLKEMYPTMASSRPALVIVPVVPYREVFTKWKTKVFLWGALVEAGSPLADPELAPSFFHDLHLAEWRWKHEFEMVFEMGFPSLSEEEIRFLPDVLEQEFFALTIDDVFASPTMLKTLIASGWGKPEEWWRIEWSDVFVESHARYDPIMKPVPRRRKICARVIRLLTYWMGLRG